MKMTTEMARGLGLLVLLCLVAPLPVARSQMSLPFTGQGLEPAEPVDVYVSAMLERLLDVDDRNYRFSNIVYVYLSWSDDRANDLMIDSTLGIDRLSDYYVLGIIVPALLLVALSFITYLCPVDSLHARIGLNVTLILALTALQFVTSDQLPKSSYPTAVTKIILVSYILVAFGVPESIVVYAIASSIDQRIKEEREAADKIAEEDGAEYLDEAEEGTGEIPRSMTPRAMTRAMKFFKRERTQKIPFIIDMASLCTTFTIVVVVITVLITGG